MPLNRQSSIGNRQFRAGYSFTEVMFAVIVLGIGFIMVAAVFPVATQQSAATSEETTGASIARGAVNYLQTIATNANMPATTATPAEPGSVVPLLSSAVAPGAAWEAARGNFILPDNPRFAWVALYRRSLGANVAQIFIIPVQTRMRSSYFSEDTGATGDVDLAPDVTVAFTDPVAAPLAAPPEQANLYPRDVTFDLINDNPLAGTNIDTIEFDNAGAHAQGASVAEGSYVIVGNAGADTAARGRVYRIGVQRLDLDATGNLWELQAGNDIAITGTGNDLTGATGFVVGREVLDPAAKTYEGPAQDIGIYTTFIQVR